MALCPAHLLGSVLVLDAGAAELDRADLVAVGIVDVGVRHDERDPEAAGAVDRRGADGRSSPAASRLRSSCRFGHVVGRPATTGSISRPCDAPLEDAACRRGRTCGTPARRSETRRRSRRSDRRAECRCSARDAPRGRLRGPVRRSVPIVRFTPPLQRVLGDQRAGLRLRHQDRRAGVLQRPDAVQHAVARARRAS